MFLDWLLGGAGRGQPPPNFHTPPWSRPVLSQRSKTPWGQRNGNSKCFRAIGDCVLDQFTRHPTGQTATAHMAVPPTKMMHVQLACQCRTGQRQTRGTRRKTPLHGRVPGSPCPGGQRGGKRTEASARPEVKALEFDRVSQIDRCCCNLLGAS